MGAEVLSSVATSIDPTWIGAMLYTYPIQFVLWSLLVAIAFFLLGFFHEKRKADIAASEVDLLKVKSEYELEMLHSMQDQNKELLAGLKAANEQLVSVSEEYRHLLMSIEPESTQANKEEPTIASRSVS